MSARIVPLSRLPGAARTPWNQTRTKGEGTIQGEVQSPNACRRLRIGAWASSVRERTGVVGLPAMLVDVGC
jgi:hypothetical protein